MVCVLGAPESGWAANIELQRLDVAEGAKAIRVARAVTHRDGCRVDTPKSGKGRSVIVPPHIRPDLLHHLATHVGKDPTAQLFPAVRGCHLNDRVFRDYLAPALKTIGREDMRIHDLRHFAGTMAARAATCPKRWPGWATQLPRPASSIRASPPAEPKRSQKHCPAWLVAIRTTSPNRLSLSITLHQGTIGHPGR